MELTVWERGLVQGLVIGSIVGQTLSIVVLMVTLMYDLNRKSLHKLIENIRTRGQVKTEESENVDPQPFEVWEKGVLIGVIVGGLVGQTIVNILLCTIICYNVGRPRIVELGMIGFGYISGLRSVTEPEKEISEVSEFSDEEDDDDDIIIDDDHTPEIRAIELKGKKADPMLTKRSAEDDFEDISLAKKKGKRSNWSLGDAERMVRVGRSVLGQTIQHRNNRRAISKMI